MNIQLIYAKIKINYRDFEVLSIEKTNRKKQGNANCPHDVLLY